MDDGKGDIAVGILKCCGNAVGGKDPPLEEMATKWEIDGEAVPAGDTYKYRLEITPSLDPRLGEISQPRILWVSTTGTFSPLISHAVALSSCGVGLCPPPP